MARRPQCPRCAVALETSRKVRSCPDCRGSWLDHEQVTRLVVPELELVDHRHEPLACPVCRQAMQSQTLHGIAVDRCSRHGMWFDRDERDEICKRARGGTRTSSGASGVIDGIGSILEALGQLMSAL